VAVTSGSKIADQVFAIAGSLVAIALLTTILTGGGRGVGGTVAVIKAGAGAFTDAIRVAGQF
jgi:hypothetical protein